MELSKIDTSDWTVDDHIAWMRHHGETVRIMQRLGLNTQVTTMVHYDLPWMKDFRVSEHLDALAVQRALTEHGPSPVLSRAGAEKGDCECGGRGDSHYLSCSIWPHNHR